jgi:hypothetical protein
MASTLADRVAALDRARFSGRVDEIALLEGMLADGESGRVVLLHGPGGIGKSALLRELARRADARGFTACVLDAREVMPVPGEVERALEGVASAARPLLIFDSYERMAGIDGWLRDTLLPSLPSSALVVLASRRPPAAEWFRDGWEHVAVDVELAPLSSGDAHALLAAYGVSDPALAGELVRWAKGWPLALSLAAGTPARPGTPGPTLSGAPDQLRAVIARVTRAELEEGNFDVVAVAAIARSCSARMLNAVLPGVDADAAMAWLRGLTFAERVGDGVALHDLVRRAVRAELEERDPPRARDLRRRIADHVHDRAVGGEARMLIDLTDLIDDPRLRWGLGADAIVDYRVDSVRPGDLEALAPWYAGRTRWWQDVSAFFASAPERIVLARDARDRLAGISIAITSADPPPLVEGDAVLGSWLEHARRIAGGQDVLLWRDANDLGRNADPGSPVVSLMNTAAILDSGLANVRYSYIPMVAENRAAIEFSTSVGGRAIPELSVQVDGQTLECHVIDHGPGGMIGQLREVLYGELGLPVSASAPRRPDSVFGAGDVRDALRNFHRPGELAHSSIAVGATPEERAESVRTVLRDAADRAFGSSADERLLRAVVERGYLEPDTKHELAAEQLNLSRTAYFRRLRQASERLATWLLEQGPSRERP